MFIELNYISLVLIRIRKNRLKKMNQPKKRDAEMANRVKRTAELCGVCRPSVYRILRGDRVNEEVFTTYMELLERDNKLMEEVKKLVPFN